MVSAVPLLEAHIFEMDVTGPRHAKNVRLCALAHNAHRPRAVARARARRRAWHWPIMLLLGHAAVIPVSIPLAGAWTHPDPSDPDLLTFAIFETVFVCICAAYLFGGLAKDRIAARFQRASLIDPLTSVANRRGFLQAGERLMARTRFARRPSVLLLFDLDRFKSINDRYGHDAGDKVLTSFCRLATSQLRPNDLFGRIGGEEFASLLPNTTRQDALLLAERLRAVFEVTRHTVAKQPLTAAVSVGVATSNDANFDLSALLVAADHALHRAKAWVAIISSCGRFPLSRLQLGKHQGKPLHREFSHQRPLAPHQFYSSSR
jgi:diguanylate cyclase (GGDEF)-like protein